MKINYPYLLYPIIFQSQLSLITCIPQSFNWSCFDHFLLNPTIRISFYAEQSSGEPSPPRRITPIVLNSTEMSGNNNREMIILSSIASPGPQIVTNYSDWNETTMPYVFKLQLLNNPPSLNDLNLPLNIFHILATRAKAQPTAEEHDQNYSPQSPKSSDPSPLSTPPMNLSTTEGLETPHTTTDDNMLYSHNEPVNNYFIPSSPSPSRRLAS